MASTIATSAEGSHATRADLRAIEEMCEVLKDLIRVKAFRDDRIAATRKLFDAHLDRLERRFLCLALSVQSIQLRLVELAYLVSETLADAHRLDRKKRRWWDFVKLMVSTCFVKPWTNPKTVALNASGISSQY